jgi:hypothetical protein
MKLLFVQAEIPEVEILEVEISDVEASIVDRAIEISMGTRLTNR